MIKNFSVLMSIYYKEKPENLRECMESILQQTVKPAEIVLVEDGKLTDELYSEIERYKSQLGEVFKIIVNEENLGLGLSLAKGLKACKYELIARMDTDDICVKDRFEKQLKMFEENPKLELAGGQIEEFNDNISNVTGRRVVPTEQRDIYRYQRKRDAFNHMTVMYKKASVLAAGNYEHCLLMEDSLLWAKMIKLHSTMANHPDVLVYARTGNGLLERRGGLDYFRKYKKGRKLILKTGTISCSDYVFTVLAQLIVCLIPLRLREIVFKKILRK